MQALGCRAEEETMRLADFRAGRHGPCGEGGKQQGRQGVIRESWLHVFMIDAMTSSINKTGN